MDINYDSVSAAKRLQDMSLDRYNSAHSGTQLSRISSVTAHYEAMPAGKSWMLVLRNTNEELVVSFQGVIAKKDLPPFIEKIGRGSSHIKYLRQSVSITGFDTPIFDKVVNAVADIHAVLGHAVGLHNIIECGMIGVVDERRVVELSNRYFKPRHALADDDEVALTSSIDPYGHLAKAAANMGLYHSEENVVQYYERQGGDDNNYRYTDAKPSLFGVGDIVEAQASFTVFPVKDGKYKTVMILRGLTLLDGTFTQARVRDMLVRVVPASSRKAIKRKVGYGDEEMSSARVKMARMDIDQLQQKIELVDDDVNVEGSEWDANGNKNIVNAEESLE